MFTTIVELVQRKWKKLRERYAKEHKKKKKGKSGDGADSVSMKEWEYYQSMNFFKEFIKHRK